MNGYNFGSARVLLMRRRKNFDEFKEDRVYDLDRIGCDSYENSMAIKALNEEQLSEKEGRKLIGFLEKVIMFFKR